MNLFFSGKIYKPKEEPRSKEEEQHLETEWDDILTQASEEELVDLAAVLGFHGMLNQTQYYAGLDNVKLEGGGFQGKGLRSGVFVVVVFIAVTKVFNVLNRVI